MRQTQTKDDALFSENCRNLGLKYLEKEYDRLIRQGRGVGYRLWRLYPADSSRRGGCQKGMQDPLQDKGKQASQTL